MPLESRPSVEVELRDAIAIVRLNRPRSLNALTPELCADMTDVLAQIGASDDILAVVLGSTGKHFMAGGDLTYFAGILDSVPLPQRPVAFADGLLGIAHVMVEQLRALPQPVVVAATGAVAGFGVSLLLSTDLAVVDRTMRISTAYLRLGASADGGLSFVLPRIVGRQRAFEMLTLDPTVDADRALELGLVNRIAADGKAENEAMAIADRLAALAPDALRAMKRLVTASESLSYRDQLVLEQQSFAKLSASVDFEEGVRAFLDKRTPNFGRGSA